MTVTFDCPECGGFGHYDGDSHKRCPECDGTGHVSREQLREWREQDDGQPTEAEEWNDFDPDC